MAQRNPESLKIGSCNRKVYAVFYPFYLPDSNIILTANIDYSFGVRTACTYPYTVFQISYNGNCSHIKTPYFQFCKTFRDNLKTIKVENTYSAKKLGQIWKSLSDEQKKPYIDKYIEEKKKYEKFLEEKKSKDASEDEKEEKKRKKSKNKKMIAKTTKKQNDLNNNKVCNCGKCHYCKSLKRIKLKLNEEE